MRVDGNERMVELPGGWSITEMAVQAIQAIVKWLD